MRQQSEAEDGAEDVVTFDFDSQVQHAQATNALRDLGRSG
jgi:hypothetical protein